MIAWGRTGASGGWLTWPFARGGSVQGFPPEDYACGVLDEHMGGPGSGERLKSGLPADAVKPKPGRGHAASIPDQPPGGTDGN